MPTINYPAAIGTDDITLGYIPEATWGVTPAATAVKLIRLDSEGFSGTKTRNRPAEIDPSGQSSAAITTKEESTGSLNFSVSAGTHNELIAASLGGTFTGNPATAASVAGATGLSPASATISVAAATTCTITFTGTTFNTAGDNKLVVGQMIKLFSTTGSQQGVARIKTVTDLILTLDCCSWTPANGALTGCNIKASMLRNGIVVQTFSFEKKLATGLFLTYLGSFPTGGDLSVGSGDYLKGTMSFLNAAETSAVATIGNAYTQPPNGTIIDSIKGIGTVWRGVDSGTTAVTPVPIQGYVQKLSIKWSKEGAAAQYAMGSKAAVGMRSGKMLVSGALSTYFKDFTLYTQYTQEKAGPITFFALDGNSNESTTKGYVITFCNATIMNPKVVAGGPGQDVMADFEIEGNPDVTSMYGGKTVQIDYFG